MAPGPQALAGWVFSQQRMLPCEVAPHGDWSRERGDFIDRALNIQSHATGGLS